jgi:hypothetical protein
MRLLSLRFVSRTLVGDLSVGRFRRPEHLHQRSVGQSRVATRRLGVRVPAEPVE